MTKGESRSSRSSTLGTNVAIWIDTRITEQEYCPLREVEGRLMRITAENLQAKVFAKVDDPEEADFVVGFTVGARDKIQVNSFPEPYRPFYGAWRWGGRAMLTLLDKGATAWPGLP